VSATANNLASKVQQQFKEDQQQRDAEQAQRESQEEREDAWLFIDPLAAYILQ
jgi:hypothetical protein